MEPRNRFQGMNSASLCSLAGRYDKPIPTRFLAPIDCLKIPALPLLVDKCSKSCRGLQGDVVYLRWPIAPHVYEPKCVRVSANENSCAHHLAWSPIKLWISNSIFNLCSESLRFQVREWVQQPAARGGSGGSIAAPPSGHSQHSLPHLRHRGSAKY